MLSGTMQKETEPFQAKLRKGESVETLQANDYGLLRVQHRFSGVSKPGGNNLQGPEGHGIFCGELAWRPVNRFRIQPGFPVNQIAAGRYGLADRLKRHDRHGWYRADIMGIQYL